MANVCPKSEEFSLPPNEVLVAVDEAKVPDGDSNLTDKTQRRNLIRRSFSASATHGLFPGEECNSPDKLSKYTARIGMAKHKSDSDLRRTNILHGAQQHLVARKVSFIVKPTDLRYSECNLFHEPAKHQDGTIDRIKSTINSRAKLAISSGTAFYVNVVYQQMRRDQQKCSEMKQKHAENLHKNDQKIPVIDTRRYKSISFLFDVFIICCTVVCAISIRYLLYSFTPF